MTPHRLFAIAAAAAVTLSPLHAVQAGHPLASDDSGTQGTGAWQFEASLDQSSTGPRSARERETPLEMTLTYGLTEQIDLSFGSSFLSLAAASSPTKQSESGLGDSAVGLKWRFADDLSGPAGSKLSLALTGELGLPTGESDQGLGAGAPAQTLNAIAQMDWGRTTLLLNSGLAHQSQAAQLGSRRLVWSASAAVLHALSDRHVALFDLGLSRQTELGSGPNPAFAIVGLIYSPRPTLDLDIGYRVGLNKAQPDHQLGVGLTVRF